MNEALTELESQKKQAERDCEKYRNKYNQEGVFGFTTPSYGQYLAYKNMARRLKRRIETIKRAL